MSTHKQFHSSRCGRSVSSTRQPCCPVSHRQPMSFSVALEYGPPYASFNVAPTDAHTAMSTEKRISTAKELLGADQC